MSERYDEIGPALARFALGAAPVGAFHVATFMNWYAVTLAGARRAPVETMCRALAAEGAQGACRPLGRDERLPASAAVGLDCLSSATLAYDDIHFATTLHPAGPVAAAICGVARLRPVTGAQALQALRVGMEIECRLSAAMFNCGTGAATGWYPTGMAGGFGAAAAAGRLLELDAAGVETALALAASRASGTRGSHGAMTAYWPPALAAEAGFAAALMAQAGFTAGMGALSGPNGLLRQIAPTPDLDALLGGLGTQHRSEETAPKIYPYGFIAYAPIDCATRAAEGGEMASAVLTVSPTCAGLGGQALPSNMFEAQVALRLIVARTLADPASALRPVPEDFAVSTEDAGRAARVDLREDPALANDRARLQVTYANGGEALFRCDAAPGSVGNPLPAGAVAEKAHRLLSATCGAEEAGRLMDLLEALPELTDLSEVLPQ